MDLLFLRDLDVQSHVWATPPPCAFFRAGDGQDCLPYGGRTRYSGSKSVSGLWLTQGSQ